LALIRDFFSGSSHHKFLDSSFITFVPKKDSPACVNDYRTISLVGGVAIKILTKLHANKVQKVILQLVHDNQYGFIKHRTIQDFLGWAFQYLTSVILLGGRLSSSILILRRLLIKLSTMSFSICYKGKVSLPYGLGGSIVFSLLYFSGAT
jgi:hypothetical protein